MSSHTTDRSDALPGEDHPIPWTAGKTLTIEEVVGVNRRLQGRRATGGVDAAPLDQLGSHLVPVAFRMPQDVLAWAKARAETDGRTLSDVLRELLNGYGHAPLGSVPIWVQPDVADRVRDLL